MGSFPHQVRRHHRRHVQLIGVRHAYREVANRVRTREADGYHGWASAGPWDAIIVTAAAEHVPPPLVNQLKPGGIMCIPVGSRFGVQSLLLVEKDNEGTVQTRGLMPVRFVPLTRKDD